MKIKTKNIGGMILISLILIFPLISTFFVMKNMFAAQKSENWDKTNATVVNSEMKIDTSDSEIKYTAEITYEYLVNKKNNIGNKITFGPSDYSDSTDVSELLSRYPQGKNISIYFNPENYSESVIEKGITGRMWLGFAFIFGFTFVLVALLLAYGVGIEVLIKKLMKNRRSKNIGKNILLSVFLLFSIYILFVSIRLIYLAHTSNDWHKTNATVIYSTLDTKSDVESTTYSPKIFYEYVIDNYKYTNNKIYYSVIGWPDPDKPKKILSRYPAGENITIYYNPEKYSQSVIEPGIEAMQWWLFGFGFVLLLVTVYLFRSDD